MRNIISEKTTILKLLGDPSRYRILEHLSLANGRLCVGDIAEKVEISPSAVSHQLAKLESSGIVKPVRKGQQICYVLEDNTQVELIIKIMKTLNTKKFYLNS